MFDLFRMVNIAVLHVRGTSFICRLILVKLLLLRPTLHVGLIVLPSHVYLLQLSIVAPAAEDWCVRQVVVGAVGVVLLPIKAHGRLLLLVAHVLMRRARVSVIVYSTASILLSNLLLAVV